jgi:HSP20 family protein
MGGFDLSGLFEALNSHPVGQQPWAQMLRQYAEQAGLAGNAQRSGETLVPEDADADAENTFIPPIDVFSTETAYVLHIALPGAKKEDVGVNWDEDKGVLNVAGVIYRQGDEEFLKTLSQSERKVGVFERSVKLPPGDEEKEEVDSDAISAKLEDGVLMVTVPKVEKEWTEIKRVDVK